MYKLEFLQLAKNDIEGIVYYISSKLNNPIAAKNLAIEIIASTQSIIDFPYGIPSITSNKKLKYVYRKIRVKNYYVFYTIDEANKVIIIARVLYIKRDFFKLLKNPFFLISFVYICRTG